VAVASRDLKRCEQFISECQREASMDSTPRAFSTYEALLASKDIDAVYIPLPTGVREEWVIRAAEAAKHVVCEKPCATSVAGLRRMIEACERHNVQFMDGVMFMHSGRLGQVRTVLDDSARFGPMKRITSAFSFFAPPEFAEQNIRADAALEPYGALGDLGWYCLRLALWAMKGELPTTVRGQTLNAVQRAGCPAVPMEFSGELFFKNGVSSAFYCSFLTAHEEWAILTGHNGHVRISDFVLPFFGNETAFEVNNTVFAVNGCDFNMEGHQSKLAVPEYSNSHPTAQDSSLFRNFADQIRGGPLNKSWPEIALKTQQVMEACFESANAHGAVVTIR
jgi:predicted dehydrogenase